MYLPYGGGIIFIYISVDRGYNHEIHQEQSTLFVSDYLWETL